MIILILLWFFYGVFKGVCDARLFGGVCPFTTQRWIDWYNGKRGLLTTKVNQGYPWSADYWHFFDTMRCLVALASMAYAPFALQGWLWWQVLLLAWLCYWIPSFQLTYKVILMKEWTLKKYLINTIQIWN
jgi:hypothetical protein